MKKISVMLMVTWDIDVSNDTDLERLERDIEKNPQWFIDAENFEDAIVHAQVEEA